MSLTAVSKMSRMSRLCQSFPSLRDQPGTQPWDQHAFARWAGGPARTSGSGAAAAFVLAVWNGGGVHQGVDRLWFDSGKFRVGQFDAIHALSVWDEPHRAAFIAWCRDPFWP
jgi:hypothetical protein